MLCARLAIGVIVIALLTGAGVAMADPALMPAPSTPVTGVLVGPNGHPLAAHELHFQGSISGDMFTVRTHGDGAFSTALPQGVYDLRGDFGAIIASPITVGESAVNLGQVRLPAAYNPTHIFDRQVVGEAIIKSPAPASAYVPSTGGAAVAVTPISNPKVEGGTPGGAPMAPPVVVPMGIREQTRIPAGAEPPPIGAPLPGAPNGGGGY